MLDSAACGARDGARDGALSDSNVGDAARRWATAEFLSLIASSTTSTKATAAALARDVSCIFTGEGAALVSAALDAPADIADARADASHAQSPDAVTPSFDADDAQSSTLVGAMLVGALSRALVAVEGGGGADASQSDALVRALVGVLRASPSQEVAATRARDFLRAISWAAVALRDSGATADGPVNAFKRTLSAQGVVESFVTSGGGGGTPHSFTSLIDLMHLLCAVCACVARGGSAASPWTALTEVGARVLVAFSSARGGGALARSHAAAALAGAFSHPASAERRAVVDVAVAALTLGAGGIAITRGAVQGASTALLRCAARSEDLRAALADALVEVTCAAPDAVGAAAIDDILIPAQVAGGSVAAGALGPFHARVFGCAGAASAATALLLAFAPLAGSRARAAVKALNLRSRAAAYAGAAADVLCAIAAGPPASAALAGDVITAAAALGAAAANAARALPPFFIEEGGEATAMNPGDVGGGGGGDALMCALSRLAREPLALALRHAAASSQGGGASSAVALAAGLMCARALSPAYWPALAPLLPSVPAPLAAFAAGVAWATAAALVSAAQDPRAPPKLAADRDALVLSANTTRAVFLPFLADFAVAPDALAQAALRLGAGTSAVPLPHAHSAAFGARRPSARAVAVEEMRKVLSALRPVQPVPDAIQTAAVASHLSFAGARAD